MFVSLPEYKKKILQFRDDIEYYNQIAGVPAVVSKIASSITGKPRICHLNLPGIQYPVYLRVPSSDFPTYEQVFVFKHYDFDVREAPRAIIDAGANIGLTSVFFANRFPEATIISIEPEKNNFDILKMNISPYKNIIPVQAALWNKNEKIDVIDPGHGAWGFITQKNDDGNNRNIPICHRVKGITIDWILSEYNIDSIDLLKVDIEGAEREVFDNATPWIEKVDNIIIEFHDDVKPGCKKSVEEATGHFDKKWFYGENFFFVRDNARIHMTQSQYSK